VRVFLLTSVVTLIVSLASAGAFAQQASYPPFDFPKQVDPLEKVWSRAAVMRTLPEPRVLSKGPLAPSVEDRNSFRSFLQDKRTGLMRLMPREIYDSATYHTKDTIKIRGGGAYYSFADLTHVYGYGSDIQLERGMLSVGFAGADYGILTNLGEVPLPDITLADPRTSVLAHYQAATSESQARTARLRLQQGVLINGDLYHNRLPLEVNATYLLRSIIFGGTDVLVAFQVVRQDTDGSIIILWRLLKKY
jgi:hypothetical protein